MNVLRSIIFAILFYGWTVIAVLLSFPASLLGTRKVRAFAHGWARAQRWLAASILGIRVKVEGQAPEGAVLVAAKHQAMFETLEMILLLKEPTVVLKRELADLPLWGWVVRKYGAIPVDRSGGAKALRRMLRAAEAAKAEGRPIIIYPEGTRVAPGETPPLQAGFAGLYRALGLPVVPVALDSGRLWPKHRLVKTPGTITIRFGEPIPPGLSRREIEERVHREINRFEDKA